MGIIIKINIIFANIVPKRKHVIRKRRGIEIEPCGTPQGSWALEDDALPIAIENAIWPYG